MRPYPDAIFNGVHSFGVLHHTDHPEQAVSEMWRIMRPGVAGVRRAGAMICRSSSTARPS
ncbi:methyltransferase domain-containing protein [Streptomyces sp. NBC_01764]|uniref:methyltransferase domain-containing protein n=1 Tax=Streptomyces sp. NBC_01764 TaxID=2975935 RepID=UPI00339023D9